MEFIIIPLIGLGGMYIVSNQENKAESFRNRSKERVQNELLPNTDIPDNNYSNERPSENDSTSILSTLNSYDNPVAYTDKYFKNPFQENVSKKPVQPPTNNSNFTSLTGENVELDYFRHNNMAPFESTLDNYTGAGSQQKTKKEQSPMFRPGDNYQWATGMPNSTDFVQSRMNPSLRMANVKPFADVKVAPGLGLGYTSEGGGGFNAGMMARDQWQERTVDELRVDNKQKASGLGLYGFEGPAASQVKEMGKLGRVEKNRVDTTFEMGQDRLFTTTGIEKGPALRPITVERMVSRPETTASYTGGAGYYTSAEYLPGEYMPSHHKDLGDIPLAPAGAVGKGIATEADYGMKSQQVYKNQRTMAPSDEYFGVVGGALGAAVAPLMDMLRPSRKENTIGNMRPYQNAKAPVERSYIFNPKDTLPTTIRETTENSKFHLNINANQRGGAYETTEYQMSNTYRSLTDENGSYTGNALGNKEVRPYDDAYRQRNNEIKSSTIDGRLVPGNMKLMNGEVYMTSKPKDQMMLNTRPADGMRYVNAPSTDTFGMVQGINQLYQGQQLDRNNGEILTQLKKNPYVIR